MAVTIKDLSAACGLSISTVSKALNGYPDVSAETREQVRAIAAKMGYRPSAIARGLKLGRTYNLGVLYSDDLDGGGFMHSYFAPVLESFKGEAERRGYDITFITHHSGRNAMTYLEHCLYRNVDGVCIVCSRFDEPEVLQLISGPLPLVTIDNAFPGHTCIQSENHQGMTALTRHVLAAGHRRVAFVHGPVCHAVSEIRLTAFLRAMQEAGVAVPDGYLIESPYHDAAAAYAAVERLLAASPRPTCIIMPDDFTALGGMQAVQAAGLSVPEDISIAGFDGVRLLQMCRPKLTTVAQNTARIGQEAARQLVHLIEMPRTTAAKTVAIPCALLPGETVRRL